jgi:MoxR-like ATPase
VYTWIEYPSRAKELEIVRLKRPQLPAMLAQQIVDFVQRLRQEELYKRPGVAETLDWAEALTHLQAQVLDTAVINATLGIILKYQDDVDKIQGTTTAALLADV